VPDARDTRYWNDTLSLLWNPNLEHSRASSYWSCYDQLTNTFAVEGLRALSTAATRLGNEPEAARWEAHRAAILTGINSALTHKVLHHTEHILLSPKSHMHTDRHTDTHTHTHTQTDRQTHTHTHIHTHTTHQHTTTHTHTHTHSLSLRLSHVLPEAF
jgi:aspartate aminotransferase-like enzyme